MKVLNHAGLEIPKAGCFRDSCRARDDICDCCCLALRAWGVTRDRDSRCLGQICHGGGGLRVDSVCDGCSYYSLATTAKVKTRR